MKKLIAVACLLVSSAVFAGDAEIAAMCAKVKFLPAESVAKCNDSGANKERITACANARFFYAEDFNSCLTMKGKTEKIPQCAKAGFDYIEDFKSCIK